MRPPVLEMEGVRVVREGRVILRDVTLRIGAGESVVILGPNGAGKSTLLGALTGYIWPSEGVIRLWGHRLGRYDVGRLRARIGLVEPSRMPEFAAGMKVRDVVATGLYGTIRLPQGGELSEREEERIRDELSVLGLKHVADDPFGRISTGERARTYLARAMVAGPELLVLDEPTAGLDIRGRAELLGMLERLRDRRKPPAILITTHRLEDMPLHPEQVILLKEGACLCEGRPEEVVTSENLSRLFDCPLRVTVTGGRFGCVLEMPPGGRADFILPSG